jgi:hypothetical protein
VSGAVNDDAIGGVPEGEITRNSQRPEAMTSPSSKPRVHFKGSGQRPASFRAFDKT